MDDQLVKIYLKQAQEEFQACFAALEAFNLAIRQNTKDDPFLHAMTFVHRAASASRIFWPPGGKNKSARQRSQRRGAHLRQLLTINDNHPIQHRTLRDHFEHFDERLDEWAEESKHRNMIGRLLGPRSAVGGNSIEDRDIILHFDPQTNIFAFRGQQFDLQELANGISDLNTKVQERLNFMDSQRFY